MVIPAAVDVANKAVAADTAGKFREAIPLYRKAADIIDGSNPTSEDRKVAENYRKRAGVLEQKAQMKEMESGVKLAQDGAKVANQANEAVSTAGGMHNMAGAAAVGAMAGAMFMGPLTAIAAAGGAAYATTRTDQVGDIARGTGAAAIQTVEKAKAIDKEHNISGKAMNVLSSGFNKAQELNEKYKLTEKVSQGVAAGVEQAKQIEDKYHVSSKVGAGLSTGLDAINKGLSTNAEGTKNPSK